MDMSTRCDEHLNCSEDLVELIKTYATCRLRSSQFELVGAIERYQFQAEQIMEFILEHENEAFDVSLRTVDKRHVKNYVKTLQVNSENEMTSNRPSIVKIQRIKGIFDSQDERKYLGLIPGSN